ncbi:MAG: T9SS type A sorting domain-containing protein [Bacteroidota bacterium]
MKRLTLSIQLLLFVWLSSTALLQAQGWERVYSRSDITDLVIMPDGNYATASFEDLIRKVDANTGATIFEVQQEAPGTLISWGPNRLQTNQQGDLLTFSYKSFARLTDSVRNSTLYFSLYNSAGDLQWAKYIDASGQRTMYDMFEIEGCEPTQDGGWLILAPAYKDTLASNEEAEALLFKINGAGDLLWTKKLPDGIASGVEQYHNAFFRQSTNRYSVVSDIGNQYRILDLNENGDILRDFVVDYPAGENRYEMRSSPQGYGLFRVEEFEAGIPLLSFVNDSVALRRIEVDWQGNVFRDQRLLIDGPYEITDVALDGKGNYFLTAFAADFSLIVQKRDSNNELIWETLLNGIFGNFTRDIKVLEDGGLILAGDKRTLPRNQINWMVRLDSLGNIYPNTLSGNLFEDLDEDCADLPEAGLDNWILKLDGQRTQYFLTDSLGNYDLQIEEGSYELAPISNNPYWIGCEAKYDITVEEYDSLEINIPIQVDIECPYMQVDLGVPFLRRCFEGTYTVEYCNNGTAMAEDAYIEVDLDPALEYRSSTLPALQTGDQYRFDLGDVQIEECGRFQFTVKVDCDSTVLGQTHCVEARIYPDSICLPATGWSGASIDVDAVCIGDSVRFLISNVGTATTTVPVDYVIVEDQVILRRGNTDLINAGETISITVPADGGTYNLAASQEPNHPGNNRPSVTIEGCGAEGQSLRLGFFNQFFENDGDPTVSIDCRPNIGSFDPNDKQGFPGGIGPDNIIEPGQGIEYLIRFQNTGTDTAFTVRIADQLSERLDVETLQLGVSSHPYRWELREDRGLVFYFENILLPDSNTNEAASHGFVKFKIRPLPDLPLGTQVTNEAAIFFDFNLPINTNRTLHTIDDPFVITHTQEAIREQEQGIRLKAWPNPADELVQIWAEGQHLPEGLLIDLHDVSGKKMGRYPLQNQRLELSVADLPAGIYFYQLVGPKGAHAAQGKLVVTHQN